MEDVLERRQCKEDGSASDEYHINEEFMATGMLDYYVAAYLSARASEAAGFRSFYAERVLLYKALDGKERRRAWRPALLEVLGSWLERFPDCVNKKKFRHSLGSVPADQTLVVNEDDL